MMTLEGERDMCQRCGSSVARPHAPASLYRRTSVLAGTSSGSMAGPSALCTNTSAALYELRTSGPDATNANPIARPSTANASNRLGVLRCGAEVLAEGHDVDARFAQVAHRLEHLVVGLPDADHDGALGHALRRTLLGAAQHSHRRLVAASHVADGALQAAHDLDVVGPDVG